MKYIVLEGIDGSGTTTHAKLLTDRLQAGAHEVVHMHEPTDGPIGKLTREFFEGKHGDLPGWRTMFHLFQADREQLIPTIKKHLSENRIVVSDRNFLSTMIYQSTSAEAEEGRPEAETSSFVWSCNVETPLPDLTIILEVPFEVALSRRRSRAVTAITEDHFERRDEYMRKVHAKYAGVEGPSICRVDANRSKEEVCEEVFSLVSGLLG